MTLAEVVQGLSGSHAEVLAQVKARTINRVGVILGADLQGLMIGAGLMPLIHDTSEDKTETDVVFRGICMGLLQRFAPDGEINFARADTVQLLDAFLSNATVTAIVNAGPYGSTATFKTVVLGSSGGVSAEFPDVTLKDIVEIREPLFLDHVVTQPQQLIFQPQTFTLRVNTDLPCPVNLRAEILYNIEPEWHSAPTTGLEQVYLAGEYYFRVLLDLPEDKVVHVRVVSDYVIDMEL